MLISIINKSFLNKKKKRSIINKSSQNVNGIKSSTWNLNSKTSKITFGLILVFCLNSPTITNIFGLTLFLATHYILIFFSLSRMLLSNNHIDFSFLHSFINYYHYHKAITIIAVTTMHHQHAW